MARARSTRRLLAIIGAALLIGALFVVSTQVCLRAWIFNGALVSRCPDGSIRQTLYVETYGLRRGAEGTVRVGATGNYTTRDADRVQSTPVRRLGVSVALVKGKDEEIALGPKKGWKQDGDFAESALVVLPDVPDGDYMLRARVSSPLGDDKLDLPLPIYAPARIHVITDRPLYQPGDTVQFRAVVLRARDLAPLDGRPGRWIMQDPSGEVVLEERGAAGDFGVTSGSFPLDAAAESGEWKVRWVSGAAQDEVSFRVEPFTLPRFRVEASAPKSYYRRGERPTLRGKVLYSSGAPVAHAGVELSWSVSSAWPPPAEWLAEGSRSDGLPKHATTDASGAFELQLPAIPPDLRGRATLSAAVSATDSAGDRAIGSGSILLSEDAIRIESVTEIEDGLVEGFNNRVYLRATTAAGVMLAKTTLVVKRAWEPSDKGVRAVTDEDGVAQLQLDPGPPVNVVIPPMPARPPPRVPPISRAEVQNLVKIEPPPLADQAAMDGWNAALAPCARFAAAAESVKVGLSVDPSGAIRDVASDGRALSRCFAAVLKTRRLPAAGPRVYQIEYAVHSDLPQMTFDPSGVPEVPAALQAALSEAALDARTCLPEDIERGRLGTVLVWATTPNKRNVEVKFVADNSSNEHKVQAVVARCVESKLSKLTMRSGREMPQNEGQDEASKIGHALGVVHLIVEASARAARSRPSATTRLGYEFSVTARAEDEEVGSTRIILSPGQVPDIRLRATPVLAEAGGDVEVQILRGPSFNGKLPEKLSMTHELGTLEAPVDPKSRIARFSIPETAKGWFQTSFGAGRALVYVRPKTELQVSLRPKSDRYAPGATAELAIATTSGGRGARAAVGLIGVDASLADLAPLPGPDSLARLRPKAEMRSPAFGVLDVEALATGRIRGANAAAATILRVLSAPAIIDLDAAIDASARPSFDPIEPLTDHFYTVLAELHAQVRSWEETAPKDEQMQPKTMARLWESALNAAEKKKEDPTDAFGRRLRLSRLPPDLLALTDPRQVVLNATRLPEDVENWTVWVRKERP